MKERRKRKKEKNKSPSLHTFPDRYSIIKESHDRKETIVRLDFNAYTSFTCSIECDAEWRSMNNDHPGHRHTDVMPCNIRQETLWSRNRDSFFPFSNRIHFRPEVRTTFEDSPISCSECYDDFRGSDAFLKNRGTTRRSFYLYIFRCADHVHTMIAIQVYDIFVFKVGN